MNPMWLRRKDRAREGAAAVAEPAREQFDGTTEELLAEIERLSAAGRERRDPDLERRVLWLRHLAGMRLCDAPDPGADFAAPDAAALPQTDGLPEIAGAELTPGLIRAGILRDGCLLVRGLVDPERAAGLAGGIDRAYAERAEGASGDHYEEFRPHDRYGAVFGREWIRDAGGLLAADSPRLAFEWAQMLREGGVLEVVERYLGEPAVTSVHKTTLRKVEPTTPGAWHQDGNFMGDVRALNLWVALSRCGDVAPGLDLVPRRLEHIVEAGGEGTAIKIQVRDEDARAAAAGRPIVRPVFQPGDAIFFDELFLHQTASDPSMPNPRFAVENWFFGASGFPDEYAPLA